MLSCTSLYSGPCPRPAVGPGRRLLLKLSCFAALNVPELGRAGQDWQSRQAGSLCGSRLGCEISVRIHGQEPLVL